VNPAAADGTGMRPFPFIVGCGRSGTTLLRLMLDASAELAIPPEAPYPAEPPAWVRVPEGGVDAGRVANYLIRRPWFSDWRIRWRDLREVMRRGDRVSWGDALRMPYGLYAAREGKPRFGHKTPPHVTSLAALAAVFSDARFVHLIRDGRNVALSLREAPFGPTELTDAARMWRDRVGIGRAAGLRLGPDRYREVRYEALVDDPERELRSLCAFLRLHFDDAMLRPQDRAARVLPNAVLTRQHRNLIRTPTRSIRHWRDQMTPDEVARVHRIQGATLRRLGYDVDETGSFESARRWVADVEARTVRAVVRHG